MNFEKIAFADFEDKVKINGKEMFRTNEARDIDTSKMAFEYYFYTEWDKSKNLLPKPNF